MEHFSTSLDRQMSVVNVISSLRHDIILGKYPDNCSVSEMELSKKYGVSRSTIRTALSELEKDGLLIVKSSGRKVLRSMSQKYIEDLCFTRSILECEAVKLIIQEPDNDFTRLLGYVAEFYSALQEPLETRRRKLARINTDFHMEILNLAGNISLKQCYSVIAPILYEIVYINTALDPDMNEHGYYSAHKKIADLLMQRDQKVIEYMRYHTLEATLTDVLSVIHSVKQKNAAIKSQG